MPHATDIARRPGCRAFTLTELMIAVAVLVGVLLATSKIFSTTSKVTGAGRAATDVLREAAAIERQLRTDIARLSHQGFFAIRNVGVPNDVHDPISHAVLLNPNAPANAVIRADQLVFFANGVQSPATFPVGGGQNVKAQGSVSRIYYGHAYQLGDAARGVDPGQLPDRVVGEDAAERVFPWSRGTVGLFRTLYTSDGGTSDIFSTVGSAETLLTPIDPRKWLLVRQPVLLVDDDDDSQPLNSNSRTFFLASNLGYPGGMVTARSIFYQDLRFPPPGLTQQIYHGRVDAAATELSELRDTLLYEWGPLPREPRPWWTLAGTGARELISDQLVYYPRAEREAPGVHRVDQALTNTVLGSACSSIRIEWTWADGTGTARDVLGDVVPEGQGFDLHFALDPGTVAEQPWFGLRDDDRGVAPYANTDYAGALGYVFADTVKPVGEMPNAIERQWSFDGIAVYEAIFGYNQDRPFGPYHADGATAFVDSDFTPWPTAIRVTLTLHDVDTKLEGGRDVQFVIELPQHRPGPAR